MNALYPGSFDPVTLGHMDVIARAARMFDHVYVGVLHNPDKKGCFSVEERLDMLRECLKDMDNVEAVSFSGLTVDLAAQLACTVLIRGVRNMQDLESEMSLYRVNHALAPQIDTVFLPASADVEDISSSMARQLAAFRGQADMFLPPAAARRVREKFGNNG